MSRDLVGLTSQAVWWAAVSIVLVALPAVAVPLTPAQVRGKQIYTTGTTASGRAVDAEIFGGVVLPASHHACVQCHGLDGKGGEEGGIPVPDIRWRRLSAPQGIETAFGARRPPYDGTRFRRAVRDGVDALDKPLYAMMPRFTLDDAEFGDLMAYLHVLGDEDAPGVTDETIRIGALLPADDGQGAAVRALLDRYFVSPSGVGGIHARRIEIVIHDPGPTAQTALAAARALVDGPTPVLAFVANAGTGADPVVLRYLAQRKVPQVGPLTLARGAPSRGTNFFLLASVDDQAHAAARFCGDTPRMGTAVLHATIPSARAMRHAFVAAARQRGMEAAVDESWDGDTADVLVERLQAVGVSRLVLFGPARWAQPLLDAGGAVDFHPALIASSVLLAGTLRPHGGTLSLVTPAVAPAVGMVDPLDTLLSGREEDAELGKLVAAHAAMGRTALAAVGTLTKALGDTGRRLDRQGLLESLSAMRGFETGMMPPITFGPNRRVGVRGALITTFEVATGRRVASEWIDVADSVESQTARFNASGSVMAPRPKVE